MAHRAARVSAGAGDGRPLGGPARGGGPAVAAHVTGPPARETFLSGKQGRRGGSATGALRRLVAVCERLDLALAQPAQSLASHAGWPITRRRGGSMARETRFVEIGPVTCFRRDAWAALTPFPPLRFGWGLDLHWAALAAERG